MPQQFQLGQIVLTPGALHAFEETNELVYDFIHAHANLEQGELDDEDHRTNLNAVRVGARILSAYKLKSGTKIWVITEADRSVTTILLPDEY